jgi:hypothetical protein
VSASHATGAVSLALAQASAAVAAARAAPLSVKKAWLAALLVDAAADALFAARHGGRGEDILAFRAGLAAQCAALGLVFGVAGRTLQLVTEAVEVPVRAYPKLGVEDFMVSLYNGQTVPRVRVALTDGGRADVHEALAAATAFLAGV